jgi:hypothetical protein
MPDDEILAEIRQWREEIYEEAGGTFDGYVRYLRAAEEQYRDRLVSTPSQNTPSTTDEPQS